MSKEIIPESVYWEAIRRGINPMTVYQRWHRGWKIEDIYEPAQVHIFKNKKTISKHAQRVLDYKKRKNNEQRAGL